MKLPHIPWLRQVRLPRWSVAPYDIVGQQRKNFQYVQVDAIAVGLSNAASPFLPVFLTRLQASNLEVGLLTAMPGLTGLALAIFIGQFLQARRNIIPWYSASRLLVLSSYAATGLAPLLVPEAYLVRTVLAIWALATLPQIALNVCFSVVMNAVAGPNHRYELMSRRWSMMGLTTALAVTAAGQVLDRIRFPINYQAMFMALSVGGLLSYYFSSQIILPETVAPPPRTPGRQPMRQRLSGYINLVRGQAAFIDFLTRRTVFQAGVMLAYPLFPIYFVRQVQADDSWIGFISTAQTASLLIGYFLWPRLSRKRGARFVLLASTFGLSLYPLFVAGTYSVVLIAILAGLMGIFQAGIDLVFFDELMKTVPVEYSATFVALSQTMNYLPNVIAPLIGTWLVGQIGIGWALVIGALLRGLGFLLFFAAPRR